MQEFTCKITDNYKMLLNFTYQKNIIFFLKKLTIMMYTQFIGNDSNKISRYGAIKQVLLCIPPLQCRKENH